ncbi:orotidine 5'-phosphate decarboxylase [Candidatus Kaiserbacteria bacterium RIFCSPLOWO2_01_FULL_54_13]|uniref:Orotidine 5'-phosphate decarboxylase n=1 Tax=Candidatus Kaiserbacteria bacterium RIFCSPLOWO2_01_FULL_54_13 TaxID=1798512 RepID=A0A1F6F1T9_9BACT|nr:MAG: orotidine 5'-phosphate decarboxylase [Candidatus Kaiserbacteria bacterium RIFCSPLOWO2_01_FULL_54_13]
MGPRNFRELLEAKWDEKKFLCIGLDSELEKVPEAAQKEDTRTTLVAFNRAIVDATKDIVCAYKPNPAFYEAHGDEGLAALRETIFYILEIAPGVPVILDAKRGDIANSNEQYARAAFEYLHADAITVQPYLGREPLEPFYKRKDKGVIVLCHTSNPGADEIQGLKLEGPSTGLGIKEPLYKVVARLAATTWNNNGNSCVMVGATYPEELREVRAIVGDMPILIAGIGAQDGDLADVLKNGLDSRKQGLIVNVSRSVIFASKGADFAEAARTKAEGLHKAIKSVL